MCVYKCTTLYPLAQDVSPYSPNLKWPIHFIVVLVTSSNSPVGLGRMAHGVASRSFHLPVGIFTERGWCLLRFMPSPSQPHLHRILNHPVGGTSAVTRTWSLFGFPPLNTANFCLLEHKLEVQLLGIVDGGWMSASGQLPHRDLL